MYQQETYVGRQVSGGGQLDVGYVCKDGIFQEIDRLRLHVVSSIQPSRPLFHGSDDHFHNHHASDGSVTHMANGCPELVSLMFKRP